MKRRLEQSANILPVHTCVEGAAQPAVEAPSKRRVGARRWRRNGGSNERPETRSPVHEPVVLQLAIRLQHGVRVDRERADHLLHGWKLVAGAKHPESDRVTNLMNELEIRRDARPCIESKLDHLGSPCDAASLFTYDPREIWEKRSVLSRP